MRGSRTAMPAGLTPRAWYGPSCGGSSKRTEPVSAAVFDKTPLPGRRQTVAFRPSALAVSALLAPVLFVLVWSTGFIVARAIDGAAAPGLFLCARFVLTTLLFGGIAFAAGARWPARDQWPTHLIAGALLQGVYRTRCWPSSANTKPTRR